MARRVPLLTFVFGTSDTHIHSAKISMNQGVHQGKMVGFKIVQPDWVNGVAAVVTIQDADGDTIYTSGNMTHGVTTVVMGLDIPLCEKEIVTVTLAGAHGGVGALPGGNVTVRLYYHPDPIQP